MRSFSNECKELEDSNEEVRQIIQQFDHTMSLKVNKSAFIAI